MLPLTGVWPDPGFSWSPDLHLEGPNHRTATRTGYVCRAMMYTDEMSMTLEDLRRTRRDQILRIAASHGARNVRVFGSAARGDASPTSDIDLLVDLDADRTLMDLGGLLVELQELLQARVDVATVAMLRPKVRERALADAVPL